MPLRLQRRRQLAGALRRPAQRRLRISAGKRIYQRFEIGQEGGVFRGERLIPAPRTPDAPLGFGRPGRLLLEVSLPFVQGAPRQPGGLGHPHDAAAAQLGGLGGGPDAPGSLIQERAERLILPADAVDDLGVGHAIMESHAGPL